MAFVPLQPILRRDVLDPNRAAFPAPDPDQPSPYRYPTASPLPPGRPAAGPVMRQVEPVRTVTLAPAPPRPIPPAAGTDPREALRAAIITKGEADAAVARAQDALRRGQGLVDEAEQALVAAQEAEAADIAHHATALRQWVTSGNGADRPPAPGAGSSRRAEAETQLAAAISARDALARDVVTAEKAALDAEMRVAGAVQAVIAAEAASDADRLVALLAAISDLRDRLAAVSRVTFSVPGSPLPCPIQLRAAVMALLQQHPSAPPPDLAQAFADYAIRLRGDADATLAEPEVAA